MCEPTSAALIGGMLLSGYGAKRSGDSAQNAQFRKMSFDSQRQNQEFLAGMQQNRDVFAADQTRASEIQAIQAQERQRLQGLTDQQAMIGQERLKIIADQINAQDAEFWGQQDAVDTAVAPVEEIASYENNEGTIDAAQSELAGAIDESARAGNQDVGASKGFGRVSQDYVDSAEGAKQSNISKAKTRARRIGTGVGIGNLQQGNSESIADAGFMANVDRARVGRQLNQSNQMNALRLGNLNAQEGALSRQDQLNRLLSEIDRGGVQERFNLAQRGAEINNAIAPEEYRYIDPTNRSAQLYSLIGQGLSAYGSLGGLGGAGGAAGQSNLAVNADPTFVNRFAGIA